MQGDGCKHVAQISLANRGDLETTPGVEKLAKQLHDVVNEALASECPDEPGVEFRALHYTETGNGKPALLISSTLKCAVSCALRIIFEQGLIEPKWMPGKFFPISHGIIPAFAELTLVGETGTVA